MRTICVTFQAMKRAQHAAAVQTTRSNTCCVSNTHHSLAGVMLLLVSARVSLVLARHHNIPRHASRCAPSLRRVRAWRCRAGAAGCSRAQPTWKRKHKYEKKKQTWHKHCEV
uniref:Uncharacterized protein n=1 Tax=Rhipicephalus zambeziensis TaxID=60191 RepID=A0A224Y8K3_9ACAR